MTLFDLLFIVVMLLTVVTIVRVAIATARGQLSRARLIIQRLAMALAGYMACVIAVSLATPQAYAKLHEDQCSDDWCIAVIDVVPSTTGATTAVEVHYRLRSRARRTPQRERYVATYMLGNDNRRYYPDPRANSVPFDTLLAAGEDISATRHYFLSEGTRPVGVVITREGGGRFPRCCIIGEQSSVFHKPLIVRWGN